MSTFKTIFGIGRNYALHAKELGNPIPDSPVVFLKPGSSYLDTSQSNVLRLTQAMGRVDHEVELVVRVGRGGKNIAADQALNHIEAACVGIDFTARDLQTDAKKNGLPWALCKGFDGFAAVGSWASSVPADWRKREIVLMLNGEIRQRAFLGEMLFSVERLVSYLSSVFTLQPGDLIFTGTPAGVGPVETGDQIQAEISGLSELSLAIRKG